MRPANWPSVRCRRRAHAPIHIMVAGAAAGIRATHIHPPPVNGRKPKSARSAPGTAAQCVVTVLDASKYSCIAGEHARRAVRVPTAPPHSAFSINQARCGLVCPLLRVGPLRPPVLQTFPRIGWCTPQQRKACKSPVSALPSTPPSARPQHFASRRPPHMRACQQPHLCGPTYQMQNKPARLQHSSHRKYILKAPQPAIPLPGGMAARSVCMMKSDAARVGNITRRSASRNAPTAPSA